MKKALIKAGSLTWPTQTVREVFNTDRMDSQHVQLPSQFVVFR